MQIENIFVKQCRNGENGTELHFHFADALVCLYAQINPMTDSYLNLAKFVLNKRGRPLTAQQILEDARKYALLPEHLSGQTMQKTLQARIAEDIFDQRENSAFCRTAIGTYFLRSLWRPEVTSAKALKEFHPAPRRRPKPKSRIFCVEVNCLEANSPVQFVDYTEVNWQSGTYHFEDDIPSSSFKVMTFSVLISGLEVLHYQIGRHSYFLSEVGKNSIGLMRYIDEFDLDLFSTSQFGSDLSAVREIFRNISSQNANIDDRFLRSRFDVVGYAADLTSHSLAIVLKINLFPRTDFETTRRLDVNRPKWVSLDSVDLSRMDEISTLVISTLR
jgi:hypothetical protein